MNIKSKLHIAQQEVYYGQLMDPKNPLYNIGGYTIFKGSFNTSQFKHVIEGLSKVFDVFNIRFDFTENEPSFYLKDFQEKVTIDELDFSSEIEPRVAAKEWMQAQFNIAFDLNQEKLYIYTLIKIAEDEFWWFVCFHHLITDGFGFAVKVNYVIGEYENLIRGGEKSEVVYPSYLDATKKSFDYLLSEQYHKDVIYWNEKYSSIPNSLLNNKRQKKELGGNRISILISKEDRELFNRLSLDTKANISQFTIAALLLYLGKTTDKETFSLGIPVHNRSGRNERKTLGMFAGILPYKGKYVGEQILSDVISEIQQTQRNDYKHRLYPISYLNRSLKLLSESRWQLFDIVVNYEPLPFPKSLSPNLHIEIKHLASTLVEYPLSIRWSDYGEDSPLELNVDYQRGYFEKNEVEMLIKRLLYIIRQFEFGLNKPIEDISIIPIEEEKQLLHLFNDTAVAYSKDKTVVDLFEEQVKKTPDAIAVVYEGEALSYKELDEKSNQLGHYLIEQGVEPDTLIGICLERSLEMLIGILGILKSGGAYVPVDPDYPSDRIGYMLGDAGIKLVLSREDNHKILADYTNVKVVLLDKDWEKISVNPTTALNVALSPSHLAYVIYTSGSTGRPKGVMNEHGGIVNRLLWGQSHYKLNSEDTILQKTSFSFDVSVWELLWSVTCGAKLIFAKPEGHKDVIYLKRIIEEYSITTIHFVPSMLSIFLGTINQGDCSSLKLVICSGEALQLDQIDMFKEKFNRVRLDNLYGPTEAAIEVSSWEVPLEGFLPGVLIGQPVANTSLYIVDDSHQLLPIGVIGELCIGGIQVARGYLNQEELTREKFIENPFKEGDRIYKTGDLARWLPDGNLEFIGRKDNQVKIRGYRIELGEIENVLSSVRGISQCCVLAKEDSNDTKRLVGYVVVEGKLDRAALQEQLKLSLPEYMVPMIWVELAELPLTSNGKLDRKALPDPDSSDLSTKEYVAPRTETEHQLVQIWENLLGIEKVGVHDNFFELGGHSLLATRLVSIIRKELSIEISIREVFEYTTIATLSSHVSSQSKGVLLPAVVVEDRSGRIPLSFSQERLWFLDQLQGSLEYHMPIALRLEGALDASILEQTLQSIVSRHEVLRTILLSEDGIGYQEVISEKEWILDQVVISDKSLFENILQDYLMAPFDLSADYKLRACLYDLGDQKYILACVLHHIASDGWSEGILVNEFMELYSALQSGRAAVLPELSLQYSDYAIWQRKYLEGAVLDSQLSYWEEKLEGVGTLSLPTDYARPSIQSTAGSNVSLTLDKNLSDSLNALCQAEGVTLFMLMLSAFKVLLSRYSGQDDICVGTPIANRTQSELEGMIGFFVNTLALRSDLSGNPDFRELLKRVKETTLGSYDHQLAPFEKVVDRVVTTRDMSMSPLFQVMFVLQNTSEGSEGLVIQDVEISNYEFDIVNSKFDLTLNISENNSGIGLDIVYCADLFDKSTIDRMLLHYKELLISILGDITQPVGSLSMLTKEEEYQLLHLFNDTTVAYPKDKTIVDLFEEQVKKTPDAIAVVYEGETLSYRELNEKSNQLGHYLIEQGVEPDTLVGICLERSLEMLIGILGILKSGGAYVPVDPDYPSDRIGYMLVDAGIKLVLSREDSHKILADYKDIAVLLLDKDWAKISVNPTTALNVALLPSHLAYVIYTSGSTGKPKGVMIEHINVINLITSQINKFNIDSSDIVLQFSNFIFDASVEQIFIGLSSGSKLIFINKEKNLYTENLLDFIDNQKITHFHTTPSMLSTLSVRTDLHSLKRIVVGGEICNKDLIVKWNKGYEFYNEYGPTETTVTSTLSFYDRYIIDIKEIGIGTPINNTQIYILDSQMSLLPIGVVGELCISGAGVARGYLNQEELTREKFIENPFKEGDRIYKTGDLARWLPDGNLEFIGRKDNQVKIRGYRIELGEIENVLSSVRGISQCCVLAKADSNDTKRLVGYVVVEGKLDRAALQEQLKLSLPEYMVPMIWVELAELPLTSNGKLDRKALPDPDSSDLSTKEYVAPRTETEHQLAQIWENLLGVEKVGVHDNFFELGGHSLLATRLVSMIRKGLSIEISIREVFEYTTIATLSSHVSSQSVGILLPAVIVENRPQQIPLSFSQERLWFLDQLQGSLEYHMPIALRLEGALDASILEQTLQSIVSRHEVLRTILLSEDGIGYQEVISEKEWILDQVEIRDVLLFENILQDYLRIPFDLSADYKLRACLYDLGDQKYILACVLHHIASDGWSEGILVNEFMELYSALQSGRAAVLPELSLQYSDYAIWQRKYLEGAVLDSQLSYWEEKLEGVGTLSLPTDYARPSIQSTAGSNVSLTLDKNLSDSLNALCQAEGVTLFMLMLSAFKVLLSRYSGQDDICVGTPIANRTQSELEGMIGFFVNTLALRSDLSGNPDFRELLKRVKETTLGSYDHQLAPFEKVVDRVVTTRDMSMSPLFQVMFVLQNTSEGSEGLVIQDVEISNYEFDIVNSKFDLTLNISENNSGIGLDIVYCADLFDKSTIDRMLLHYKELLISILGDITQPVGSLSMLTKEEEYQLLHLFNDTTVAYPKDKTIVDLFEEQVKKTPDAIAVVYEGETLSYRELNEKSNQLGHYLIEQGVEPDTLVGICLERSLEMLIGILGILKSGGAYVPVDPDYPSDRISYMLVDAGIKLVLSREDSHKILADYKDIAVLLLDKDWAKISVNPTTALNVALLPSHLAYVIYTSGSTGKPKGVMIEHTNVINLITSQINKFNIDSSDIVLQFSNFIFDASVEQIFIGLSSGSKLIFINKEKNLYTENLLDFIDNQKITHFHTTPSMLSTLSVRTDLHSLKRIVVGGEICNKDLIVKWNKGYEFYNEYGPTETTVTSTLSFYDRYIIDIKEIGIGTPINNTQIYILDSQMSLLPIGVVGELCISGAGVARGYLNQEELTREKFISSPFVEGDRIYKTGDLARWLPDGNLEFIGRKDNQVKIRGYRIELGEIENVLSSVRGISQCCVLAKADSNDTKRLVGYVVVEGKLDRAALQEQLKLSLPEYMVPMIWVELAELPLTSNGKLDRKALPDPDSSDLSTKEYVAPRTETEHQLAQIWENLLGVEKVGVHDNFFELGGHSLLATRLVSMIRKELSIEVSIREIFQYNTISALATHVSVQSEGVLLPAVVVEDRSGRIPLSFSQERLWFLDQLEGSVVYHIPIALRLEGALDTSILEQTLQSIVSRHEVLRTILLSEDGVGYQEVISEKEWILDQVVIRDVSLFENILQDYLRIPFDLSADYKLRACLYDLGDQKYILACVLHHIASDGWSEGILVNEFMEFYSALQSGRAAVLPELSLQYSDYAIWQRKYLEGAVLDSQLSYWEEKLEGVGTLSLPTDYARPSIQSTAGSNVSLTLDKNLSDSLNALCQAEGVTLFMLMLSAFKVLLSRYSGQDDICVGTPIANRTQSELEGMIGFFVNTLALRSDLSGNPDFRELLKRVKETTLGSYDHQLAPFEKVVDRVVTTRDMSMSPLFQVMFVLQNTSEGSEGLVIQDVEISNYEFDIVNSKFDLTLNISENNSGIGLDIVYCADLFDKATIDRMLLHYKELLLSIVIDIDQPVGSLSMLTKEEEYQLLHLFNDTTVAYPKDKTIVDLFEEQVKKTPDAIAVVYEGETLSYRELNEKSNQLGHYLRDLHYIDTNDVVTVRLGRSEWMIIAILGIMKAGGAYLPIDINTPKNRVNYIIKDSCSKVIIDQFEINKFIKDSYAYDKNNLSEINRCNNLAYLMYTSGTTGMPKGVMIEHKSLVDYFFGITDTTNISDCSTFGLISTIAADLGNTVIYASLLTGGSLYVFSEEEIINTDKLANLNIDCLKIVPSHWKALQQNRKIFVPNKCLIFGGEQLTIDIVAMIASNNVSCQVYNHYGPTETTIGKLIKKISFLEEYDKSIPLGIPFGNTKIFVLDSKMNLLPIGVVGELCIGGPGVARGYLNQEELTREKFIENPFKEGDRIYKTGDLARWLPDGTIEYIGRKDNQVKIRGYRIELGEIENVLSSVRGISQCCVLAKEDSNDTKRLVGYVVSEGKLDKSYLEDQLKLSLPEYMVPMIWVELTEMPLTSNGKLDRKALPDVDSSDLSRKEYVAPRSDTEKQLAEIWQSLLGLEKVGVYDNFFELGGHSLLAVQLISRLQKLGFHIGVKDIFSGPTIALISDKLSSLSLVYSVPVNGIRVDSDYITPSMVPLIDFNQSDLDELVGMVAGGVSNIADIYPLSPLQEGIYFHHLMSDPKAGDPYVLPSLLSFPDNDKRNFFIEALQFVVNRHDVLRTCILSFGLPQAVQVVLREAPLSLEHLVLDNSRAILSQLEVLIAPGSHWMDISKAPLLELKSADDSENDCYYLIVYQHHLIMDHVGLEKIVSEVMLYLSGNQESLGVPVLYRDFIGHTLHAQSEHDAGSYFRSLFEGIEEPTYPFDLSNILGDGKDIEESEVLLSKALSSELRETCLRLGMTPAVLFHAAYGLVVARCSNKDYAVFGSLFSGRLQGSLGAADSLGLFINTLPVLVELKGSVLDYLDQVKVLLRDLLSYEQTPLSHIQNWSGISNDMAFFSALLNYRHSSPVLSHEDHANEFDSGITVLSSHERTNYPFTLSVDDYGDDFGLKSQIDQSIGSQRIVEYMKEALTELLEAIKSGESSVMSLVILPKEEQHELLYSFNDTAVAYPKDKTVVDLFEEQVKKTPDAIAVVYEGEALSYKELDEKSNQLGHYLIEQGVEPDTLVGICLERSLEMLIGILGILKSGGAYVPVDPDYPSDRIGYMLGDAGIKLVLSMEDNHKILADYKDIDVLLLDKDWEKISVNPTTALNVALSPSHLAYVIYTSGSTGKPKGVMNEHGGIVNRLLWTQSHYKLRSEDTILQKTSFSFDVSVWELLWSVTCGSRLVFAKAEGHRDAIYLKRIIEEYSITTIHFVPSMLSVFLSFIEPGDCSSLERVLCSGEALQLDQIVMFKEKFSQARLDNLYGPTEAAIDVSSWEVPLKDSLSGVLIGQPVDNTSLYVVDDSHQLLPIGVAGELCIGGIQVARGYLNQEELTREKFIENPFKEGDRIYKTGDLARWLPDGTIEYIGRKDNQVKIRGYRIELGEIENVLSSVRGISQCCVLAKEDSNDTKRLVGYVVSEGKLDKSYLEDQLKLSLPEYMVPMIWVELTEMPLTSNGKLDRKALPDVDSSDLSRKEYVAPRSDTEKQLAEIWQSLLGLEKVGVYDNFFELGGHSLLAVQLISRLQKLGFHIGVKDIFSGPTIALISDKLSSLSLVYSVPVNGIRVDSDYITPSMVPLIDFNQSDLDELVGMVAGGVSNIADIYPLSPLQEGIYFHHLMSDPKAGDPYVLPSLLSFPDNDKRNCFIEALQFVVNRHDVLRTCILSFGLPQAVQVVLREAPLSLEHLVLDNSRAILSQLEVLIAPGSHWMDISKAPLLELKSADDSENDCYYLIVYQHHLIMDHVGLEKIVSEVMLYLSGNQESLGVPVLYRDFIGHTLHAQSEHDAGSYFRSLFEGIEEPTYPFDLSNILGDGKDIEESEVLLSKALSSELRETCLRLGMTPAVLFHAAYGLVVARCSNKDYAVFGSLFSGRLQGSLGAADSLGLFINTLPVLVELKGSVLDYLDQVKVLLRDLLSYEQTPLSHIQNWSGISNDMAFFSALLNYRHSSPVLSHEDHANEFDSGITVLSSHERTNYPFTLSVDDYGDDFGLKSQIDQSIGSQRIVEYMKEALTELLEAIKNGESSVMSLVILPKEEQHELLYSFNDTAVAYPKDKTVVDLFEEQVKKTPDAIAVVYEGEALSYKELDEKSNQLGHYLIEQGVEPDTLVGICLERSLEMLIGILGILKSGGAYVPVDPDYPSDRIGYMLGDAGIKLVLSREDNHKILADYTNVKVVLLDKGWEKISVNPTTGLNVALSPSHLAYVIYTSGSTGKPKGVMIEHSSLVNYLLYSIEYYGVDDNCFSFPLFSSLSFDLTQTSIYLTLLTGGQLHIYQDNNVEDVLNNIVVNDSITSIKLTPAHLSFFKGLDGSKLKRFIIGGEQLTHSDLNNLDKLNPLVKLFNEYGPTESTIGCSVLEITNYRLIKNINIGSPISNTSIYIINEELQLLPMGIVGELCVSGAGVARGYLNQEELTREKFIENPFKEGDRIYKTGDLARWLPDGNLEFIGRKDNQVKIRGYRIELGEIEKALSSVSGIIHCCVLAKEDSNDTKRLVGYVVVEGKLDRAALQEQLKLSLPEYMIPMIWVELEEMPLTSNGKLDRKALPDPDSSDLSTKEYVAPRTDTEHQLAQIWENLLGVEKVGVHDNFFELGGHSLLATRLVSMIRKELLIEISIRNVFKFNTVEELSSYVDYKLRNLESNETSNYSININI